MVSTRKRQSTDGNPDAAVVTRTPRKSSKLTSNNNGNLKPADEEEISVPLKKPTYSRRNSSKSSTAADVVTADHESVAEVSRRSPKKPTKVKTPNNIKPRAIIEKVDAPKYRTRSVSVEDHIAREVSIESANMVICQSNMDNVKIQQESVVTRSSTKLRGEGVQSVKSAYKNVKKNKDIGNTQEESVELQGNILYIDQEIQSELKISKISTRACSMTPRKTTGRSIKQVANRMNFNTDKSILLESDVLNETERDSQVEAINNEVKHIENFVSCNENKPIEIAADMLHDDEIGIQKSITCVRGSKGAKTQNLTSKREKSCYNNVTQVYDAMDDVSDVATTDRLADNEIVQHVSANDTVEVEISMGEKAEQIQHSKNSPNNLTNLSPANFDKDKNEIQPEFIAQNYAAQKDKPKQLIPSHIKPLLGKNVSGRFWKSRFHSQQAIKQRIEGTKMLGSSWEKKMDRRTQKMLIKEKEREIKNATKAEIEAKKLAKLEQEKRKAQNELKNSSYQTISKTHKLKTMSKKQLRNIKKMQVNTKTGEIEFVSPWTGKKY